MPMIAYPCNQKGAAPRTYSKVGDILPPRHIPLVASLNLGFPLPSAGRPGTAPCTSHESIQPLVRKNQRLNAFCWAPERMEDERRMLASEFSLGYAGPSQ